ncbi:hypothetical protein [Streptomyces sp. NPDC005805]|uniref:hypothetical protein n=1 Tax=Streptomyces sp. NPDC005805 TaxID=3157068 RepID=UPI0033D04CE6
MTSDRGLRTVLADAVHDLAPSPVPLAAIARTARARRRRRVAGLAASGAALLIAPFVVTAVQRSAPPDHVVVPPAVSSPPPTAPRSPSPSPPPRSPVRVVAPGERVEGPGGVELWLTEQGKHWALPGEEPQFRSVTDGNIDRAGPGVSLQTEGDATGTFLSGVYYGTDRAARVAVATAAGPITAGLLTLPGAPGWGVWYAWAGPESYTQEGFLGGVTLSDAEGRTLASLPGPPVP